MLSGISAQHIFFAKKLQNYLEIRFYLLYLCDIKMISVLTLNT